MSFGLYVLGYLIVIGGLMYGAILMHVPTHWIVVGAIVLAGLGIVTGVKATRQKRLRELAAQAVFWDRQMSTAPRHETPARIWIFCRIRFAFSVALLCQVYGYAQLGPQPPCGKEPVPAYPGLDNQPNVKFWSEPDLGRDWKPPACTGWAEAGFSSLITTVARFRHSSGAEGLLRHMGAISELVGMRYWSTTHQQWQTLIPEAYALTGSQPAQRREDFTPAEMKPGKVLYFEQADNLSGKALYRIHIVEVSADRLVFEVENVSIMRYLFVTLFHPGEMQSIYFLDRESDNVWRYYSMVRTGRNASRLATGHESSSINRAVAFYRFVAGIPADQEPPAAR